MTLFVVFLVACYAMLFVREQTINGMMGLVIPVYAKETTTACLLVKMSSEITLSVAAIVAIAEGFIIVVLLGVLMILACRGHRGTKRRGSRRC